MWGQSKEFSSHCPEGSRQQRRKRGWGNAVCAVTAIFVASLAEKILHRGVHSRRNARHVPIMHTRSYYQLPPINHLFLLLADWVCGLIICMCRAGIITVLQVEKRPVEGIPTVVIPTGCTRPTSQSASCMNAER